MTHFICDDFIERFFTFFGLILVKFCKFFEKELDKINELFPSNSEVINPDSNFSGAIKHEIHEQITNILEDNIDKFLPRINNTGIVIVDLEQPGANLNMDFGMNSDGQEPDLDDYFIGDIDSLYLTEK